MSMQPPRNDLSASKKDTPARVSAEEEHIGAPRITVARPKVRTSSKQQIWESLYDVWHHARIKSISAYPSSLSLASMENAVCQHSHRELHCIVYAFKGLARG